MATNSPNYTNVQTLNLENNTIKINSNILAGRTNLEVDRTILQLPNSRSIQRVHVSRRK
jgi:hypothetical protein